MSDHDLEQLWDAYRDGELDDANRAAFEAWLAQNPQAKQRYDAESRWLAALGTTVKPTPVRQDDFVAHTVDRWQREQTGVMATLRWRAAAQTLAWLAAVVAVATLIWFNRPLPDETLMPTVVGIDVPPPTSPVTLLLADADDLIATQPRQIRLAVERTITWLDPARLSNMVPMPTLPWVSPSPNPPSTKPDDQSTWGPPGTPTPGTTDRATGRSA